MPNKKVKDLADKIKKLPPAAQQLVKIAVTPEGPARDKLFDEAKELLDATNPSTSDEVRIIRDMDLRIFNTKGRIKTLKERRLEIMDEHTAYHNAKAAQLAYETAKEKLRLALSGSSEYNDLMESLADEQNTLKEDQYTLSVHIVEFYAKTHERQVELDNTGDARQVIVTGKLGKREKYQTNLFTQGFAGDVSVDPENNQLTVTTEIP